MKNLIRFLMFTFLFVSSITAQVFAKDVHVKGYYRKDGTYVSPHYRSAPNGTASDNWSTQGNINPYTGKPGTKVPSDYSIPQYKYPTVELNNESDSDEPND